MRKFNRALLGSVMVLSACTAGSAPSPESAGDAPCQPPKPLQVEAEPTFSPVEGGGLRAEPVARFVSTGKIGPSTLDISERYIVWSNWNWFGQTSPRVRKSLCLFDLETGKRRKIAELRPEWQKKGLIQEARVSGDVVVYTEDEQPRDDYSTPSAWAVIAVDLKTGKKKDLAARGSDELGIPFFDFKWPWVVLGGTFPEDTPYKGTEDFRNFVAVDLRSNHRYVLVKGADTDTFEISDGLVVYEAYTGGDKDRCVHVFVVPLDRSSPPQRVARSCDYARWIQWPQIDSGMVGWQEIVTNERSETHLVPWVQIVGRTEPPIRLDDRGSNVHPGKGFVVWFGTSPVDGPIGGKVLLAKDPLSPEPPLVLSKDADLGPRWSTHHDLVVWTTKNVLKEQGPESNAYVVHVARIVKT